MSRAAALAAALLAAGIGAAAAEPVRWRAGGEVRRAALMAQEAGILAFGTTGWSSAISSLLYAADYPRRGEMPGLLRGLAAEALAAPPGTAFALDAALQIVAASQGEVVAEDGRRCRVLGWLAVPRRVPDEALVWGLAQGPMIGRTAKAVARASGAPVQGRGQAAVCPAGGGVWSVHAFAVDAAPDGGPRLAVLRLVDGREGTMVGVFDAAVPPQASHGFRRLRFEPYAGWAGLGVWRAVDGRGDAADEGAAGAAALVAPPALREAVLAGRTVRLAGADGEWEIRFWSGGQLSGRREDGGEAVGTWREGSDGAVCLAWEGADALDCVPRERVEAVAEGR